MTPPAHGVSTNMAQMKQGAFYRTRLCKFNDDCPYGNRCFYAHSEDQIRRRAGNTGILSNTKADPTSVPNAPTLNTFSRRRVHMQPSHNGECMKAGVSIVPTGTTDLGGIVSKCSFSDDESSDEESQSLGTCPLDFDAVASERAGVDLLSFQTFVFNTHPRHLATLRAWYCYERVRGLLSSYRPDTLYKILKEAEPLFYSD